MRFRELIFSAIAYFGRIELASALSSDIVKLPVSIRRVSTHNITNMIVRPVDRYILRYKRQLSGGNDGDDGKCINICDP